MGEETYNNLFPEMSNSIKQGPKKERLCNDICCYITFLVMLVGFVIMGIYAYTQGGFSDYVKDNKKIQNSDSTNSIFNVFNRFYGVIIGMLVLSFILSIIYLLLVRTFPKCMVYTTLFLIVCIFIGIMGLAIAYEIYGVAIGLGIFLLIMVCCFCCFRNQIETGIAILKTSSEFLLAKPAVYLVPLYVFLLSVLFLIFWVISLMSIQFSALKAQQKNQSTTWQSVFIAFWVFYFIFMTQFLYYVQVFLVSTACSFWYYNIQQNFFCTGSKWLNFYHIGSLTFGALIVTILKIIRALAQGARKDQQRKGNIITCVLLCLISCCLQCLEDLFKTLNQNAIIVMSVTGQSYWQCAKTAISIIFQNLGLFNIVDIIETVVILGGIILCAGLPAGLTLIIVRFNYGVINYQLAIVTLVVLFLSILVVVFFVGLLGLAANCVFIYYCMDKRFKALGINIPNVPPTIAQLFDEQGQGYGAPTAVQLREVQIQPNQPQFYQNNYNQPQYPQNQPQYSQYPQYPPYPQNNYNQPPYPQNNYNQPPYPQNNYNQPPYPQNSYNQQ